MRVQNADGSVEVQPDEEPWNDSGSATSSSDVILPPEKSTNSSHNLLLRIGLTLGCLGPSVKNYLVSEHI